MTISPDMPDLLIDPGYPSLKAFIIQVTGLAYYADKDEDLMARVARRLDASGQTDCTGYLRLLDHPGRGEVELDRLVEELTVGETSFFRHAELFEGLRDRVLPELLVRRREERRLRIWSAGCSIGAEAYSLAILLAREFAGEIRDWEISILGTDINRQFLARARDGVFRPWDFRGVERSQIEHCFERAGEDWIIRPEFRRGVSFQCHNLVRHPFPSLSNNLVAFDLIFCRNVLIYFSSELMARLVDQFHDCLSDGGWLLVGATEPNIGLFRKFETVNVLDAVLYRKEEQHRPVRTEPKPNGARENAAVRSWVDQHPVSGRTADGKKPLRRPAEAATVGRPATVAVEDQPAAPPGNEYEEGLTRLQRMADSGGLEWAMLECKRLVAGDPMNPALHLHLAMLAEQLGDHPQAEASLRKTLYLNPNHAAAHYYAGLLQQKRGRRSEAVRSYRNLMKCLADKCDQEPIPGADGLTVSELRELTRMHQEVLQET